MGFKEKFAESFARSKTMTGPEKKANEIMGKLIMKKAILPIILMVIVIIVGAFAKLPWWSTLIVNLLIAVGTYFYIKNSSEKYSKNFKNYAGNLISLEKKGKKEYTAIIKQGKLPVKLQIAHGGEDFERVKKNQIVQVYYNQEAKVAILLNK